MSDLVIRRTNFPNPIQLVARSFIVGKSVLGMGKDPVPVALADVEDLIIPRIDQQIDVRLELLAYVVREHCHPHISLPLPLSSTMPSP